MCEDTIRGHKMTDIESCVQLMTEENEGYKKLCEGLEYLINYSLEPISIEVIDGIYIIKSWHSGERGIKNERLGN